MTGTLNPTAAFLGQARAHTRFSLVLRDVQPLWGGREVYVHANGQALVRLASPTGHEQRFNLALPPETLTALVDTLIQHDFASLRLPQRLGLPDEARPEISLTNAAGQTHTLAKWAGDQHAGFEAVYAALRAIETRAAGQTPVYEGPFDWHYSNSDNTHLP